MPWKNPMWTLEISWYEQFKPSGQLANFPFLPLRPEGIDDYQGTPRILHDLLSRYYNGCQQTAEFLSRQMNLSEKEKALQFASICVKMLVEITGELILTPNNYIVLGRLWELTIQFKTGEAMRALDVVGEVTTETVCLAFIVDTVRTIHLLCGDEANLLIGIKNNTPVWHKLDPPVSDHSQADKVEPLGYHILYIGEEDRDFGLPYKERVVKTKELFPEPPSFHKMLETLEDAWANMRFFPSPEGQIILFRQTKFPVESVLLKIFECEWDKSSFGVLARFQFSNGESYLLASPDILGHLKISDEETLGYMQDKQFKAFCSWLVVQVYHDLVTAKQVISRSPRFDTLSKANRKVQEQKERESHAGWVYIPRIIYGQTKPIRRPILESREPYTPRFVRMHRRHVPMSEEHRDEILKFEDKYGLQVLRYIPEGYTVVRPYVSPEISRESWDRLPGYIKARIQLDLAEAVKQIANPTTELLEKIFENNGSDEE